MLPHRHRRRSRAASTTPLITSRSHSAEDDEIRHHIAFAAIIAMRFRDAGLRLRRAFT